VMPASIYWQEHAKTWTHFGTFLADVGFVDESEREIVFEISSIQRRGTIDHRFFFPVPEGAAEEARRLIGVLRRQLPAGE